MWKGEFREIVNPTEKGSRNEGALEEGEI